MLDEHQKQHIVVGVKQVTRALEEGLAEAVICADDADTNIIDPVMRLCSEKGVAVTRVNSKKDLGAEAGIDVSAAVVAKIR